MSSRKPLNFDNKYLIAYLCNSKKTDEFMVLLEFYRFLCNFFYKTKDYKLYQIKLKWLMEEINSITKSNVAEVDSFKLLIKKYNINKDSILCMIEAKTVDMDNFPFSSQADIINYIKNTDVVFWNFYSQILYGESLSQFELENIKNMGLAFGILEFIRFAHFKKSKSVYMLLYSSEDTKNAIAEQENIKELVKVAIDCIKKSSKHKGKTKKLLLLNYLTSNFIKNLENVRYKIDDNSISNVSKNTYLKIILSLIFRL
jgi:hypothetical protein